MSVSSSDRTNQANETSRSTPDAVPPHRLHHGPPRSHRSLFGWLPLHDGRPWPHVHPAPWIARGSLSGQCRLSDCGKCRKIAAEKPPAYTSSGEPAVWNFDVPPRHHHSDSAMPDRGRVASRASPCGSGAVGCRSLSGSCPSVWRTSPWARRGPSCSFAPSSGIGESRAQPNRMVELLGSSRTSSGRGLSRECRYQGTRQHSQKVAGPLDSATAGRAGARRVFTGSDGAQRRAPRQSAFSIRAFANLSRSRVASALNGRCRFDLTGPVRCCFSMSGSTCGGDLGTRRTRLAS